MIVCDMSFREGQVDSANFSNCALSSSGTRILRVAIEECLLVCNVNIVVKMVEFCIRMIFLDKKSPRGGLFV